jgi:hypothetical protein
MLPRPQAGDFDEAHFRHIGDAHCHPQLDEEAGSSIKTLKVRGQYHGGGLQAEIRMGTQDPHNHIL